MHTVQTTNTINISPPCPPYGRIVAVDEECDPINSHGQAKPKMCCEYSTKVRGTW